MPSFVSVDVDPGPASEDGVSLRFKRVTGVDERAPRELPYESESGVAGTWSVAGADDAEGSRTLPARAFLVEDSSDGSAWLVVGGAHGLVLDHAGSGTRVREPYLVLSRDAL